jgi:hypothetical protein
VEQVEVWRGGHGDPVPLFGPLPGVRAGDILAYEFELSPRFTPWPGRSLLERVRFLDRHLHADRDPQDGWTDFPPRRLGELAALPAPLGPIVTWAEREDLRDTP